MPQAKSDQPAEWLTYFTDFGGESERATAMLAGEILNVALQGLVGRRLRRADFAYRIGAAHELQLISAVERHDLNLVREIRSEFAHRLDAQFDDPAVAARCFALAAGRGVIAAVCPPRIYFSAAVALLNFVLIARRAERKDYLAS